VIGVAWPRVRREAAAHPGWSGMLLKTVQQAKRFFKILTGFTLLLAGGIMLVTPGPGWLTIVLGLAVLAAEFVWARRLLDRLKAQGIRLRETVLPNAKSSS